LCTIAVEYVCSTVACAVAMAAATSPCAVSVSCPALTFSGAYRPGWSTVSSLSCSSSAYVTRTASAAWRATSEVSASTTPTSCPRKATSADCRTAYSRSSVEASRSAFSWVSTARTPSSASAAEVSIAVIRPRATVACTGWA
jgi:hypothetical protein